MLRIKFIQLCTHLLFHGIRGHAHPLKGSGSERRLTERIAVLSRFPIPLRRRGQALSDSFAICVAGSEMRLGDGEFNLSGIAHPALAFDEIAIAALFEQAWNRAMLAAP